MSEVEVKKCVSVILNEISELTSTEALLVIDKVFHSVISDMTNNNSEKTGIPPYEHTSGIIRKGRGRMSKIEADHEVESFLLGIDEKLTQQEYADRCVEKFGKKRAPSRSGVNRYIEKLLRKKSALGKKMPENLSVMKATRILDALFMDDFSGKTAAEIDSITGVPSTTARRLLETLEKTGWVIKAQGEGRQTKWKVSNKLAEIAFSYERHALGQRQSVEAEFLTVAGREIKS